MGEKELMIKGIEIAQAICHGNSSKAGWWHDLETGEGMKNILEYFEGVE